MNIDTMLINDRPNISARAGWDQPHFDHSRIDEHLQQHKAFLKRGYRLGHLSAEMSVPRHILSKTINREYGMNFNRLINKMRIEYMRNDYVVADWERYTLEAIARTYGFNSRTSFIKSFKLVCGSTPSEYFRSVGRSA